MKSIEILKCLNCEGDGKFFAPGIGKFISEYFTCPSCEGEGILKRESDHVRTRRKPGAAAQRDVPS